MANANFYLKDVNSETKTLIYLFYSYDGKRLKYSTGETVIPKSWLKKKQQVRTNYIGSGEINLLLDDIKEAANSIYRKFKLSRKALSNQIFREELNQLLSKDKRRKPSTFFEVYDEFTNDRKKNFNSRTIQKYKTLRNHLQSFQDLCRYKIDFDGIDKKFYDKFLEYMFNDKNMFNNAVGKYIATLKTFMHWATDENYNYNMNFKKFKVLKDDVDIVFLEAEELQKVFNFDFTNNKRLEKVRDAFCLACYTGLRFSDIKQLRPENIGKDCINITVFKTKELLSIPITDKARQIITKYIDKTYFLDVISNQKMNKYLKEICEIVGLTHKHTIARFKGKARFDFTKPKFQFISTHTARRTFITLMLQGMNNLGAGATTVMSISGHKTFASFLRYVNMTDNFKAKEMNRIWNVEPQLKIV